jgi:transposase
MSKTGSANGSFFGNFIYDQLLRRRPHFLSDLSRAVDFSFAKAALKDFYVAWGRNSWDPVLMFKMVFLQFLHDLSDRDIEEQCTWNLLFKSFLGLSAEELPPDHTVLCRFRQRLGAEGFHHLFNQVVEQARAQGLVSDRLHIIDATHMFANVEPFSPEKGAPGTAMTTTTTWTATLTTRRPVSAAIGPWRQPRLISPAASTGTAPEVLAGAPPDRA